LNLCELSRTTTYTGVDIRPALKREAFSSILRKSPQDQAL